MLGQIATFMENLHLTYEEILNMPYRNLLMMQKDKSHVCYGEVMHEVSEEEFFATHQRNFL